MIGWSSKAKIPDTVRSVAFQVGDISSEDEYVLSFWAKIPGRHAQLGGVHHRYQR